MPVSNTKNLKAFPRAAKKLTKHGEFYPLVTSQDQWLLAFTIMEITGRKGFNWTWRLLTASKMTTVFVSPVFITW